MFEEFIKSEDLLMRQFKALFENDTGTQIDDQSNYINLCNVYREFDEATGGGHAKALDTFHSDMSQENLTAYLNECREAVQLWVVRRSEKKVKVVFKDIVEMT